MHLLETQKTISVLAETTEYFASRRTQPVTVLSALIFTLQLVYIDLIYLQKQVLRPAATEQFSAQGGIPPQSCK